jgi:hypothetical protein
LEDNQKFVKVNVFFQGLVEEDSVAISSMSVSANQDRIILSGENFGLIPHHSTVDAVGYFEDGLVIMTAIVSLSTEAQLNLDVIKTDSKQNRRKYIRVRLRKQTKLIKAYSLGEIKRSYQIDELIETRDVNLGGIGFYSNRRLLHKQRIKMDLGFLKSGLQVEAEILRTEKGSFGSGYKYKYGCLFKMRNSEEERMICEYVFRIQIDNHRRLAQMVDKNKGEE